MATGVKHMEASRIEVEKTASLLKVLGDKTRLSMIGLLNEEECCVCELVEIYQMSQPSVSQHLRKLRDAGLVKERRKGQWIFYSLNKQHAMYPLVLSLIAYIPDQREKLKHLETAGLRISCR